MKIKNITVLGLGIMGHGIAQVSAQSGFSVSAYDINDDAINKGMQNISSSLERMKTKGKIDASEVDQILKKIKTTTDIKVAVKGADVVVEVIPEVLNLKKDTFQKIAQYLKPRTIIASNTSQFSITDLASSTDRPDRFIGMHWFNPPQLMRVIELVRGLRTSEDTLKTIGDLCDRLGKQTVVCLKDAPGFITTRLLNAFFCEAFRIAEEGIATVQDIDKAAKLAFNHPMGPFELNDFGGLDTTLKTCEPLVDMYGPHFRVTATYRNLVQAGFVGRKAGQGWYNYDK